MLAAWHEFIFTRVLVLFIVRIDNNNELLSMILVVVFGFATLNLFYKGRRNNLCEWDIKLFRKAAIACFFNINIWTKLKGVYWYMKIREIMWFSLFVQITTIIIILLLLVIQKMIPDLLWGIFITSTFICILSSILVQRVNGKIWISLKDWCSMKNEKHDLFTKKNRKKMFKKRKEF